MLPEGKRLEQRANNMIEFTAKGDFDKTYKFLDRILKRDFYKRLEMYGQRGVNALAAATPKRTGRTAASWYYEINRNLNSVEIYWKNSNINNGVNIAVLIQYGHGTGWGKYVQGIDYINPAIKPIFNEMADNIWKEVTG